MSRAATLSKDSVAVLVRSLCETSGTPVTTASVVAAVRARPSCADLSYQRIATALYGCGSTARLVRVEDQRTGRGRVYGRWWSPDLGSVPLEQPSRPDAAVELEAMLETFEPGGRYAQGVLRRALEERGVKVSEGVLLRLLRELSARRPELLRYHRGRNTGTGAWIYSPDKAASIDCARTVLWGAVQVYAAERGRVSVPLEDLMVGRTSEQRVALRRAVAALVRPPRPEVRQPTVRRLVRLGRIAYRMYVTTESEQERARVELMAEAWLRANAMLMRRWKMEGSRRRSSVSDDVVPASMYVGVTGMLAKMDESLRALGAPADSPIISSLAKARHNTPWSSASPSETPDPLAGTRWISLPQLHQQLAAVLPSETLPSVRLLRVLADTDLILILPAMLTAHAQPAVDDGRTPAAPAAALAEAVDVVLWAGCRYGTPGTRVRCAAARSTFGLLRDWGLIERLAGESESVHGSAARTLLEVRDHGVRCLDWLADCDSGGPAI